MVKVSVDGKVMDFENINILLDYDYISDETCLRLYNIDDEIQLDDKSADFDISVSITSKSIDLSKMQRNSKSVDTSIKVIQRAMRVINNQLEYLRNQKEISAETYKSLCDSIMKNS